MSKTPRKNSKKYSTIVALRRFVMNPDVKDVAVSADGNEFLYTFFDSISLSYGLYRYDVITDKTVTITNGQYFDVLSNYYSHVEGEYFTIVSVEAHRIINTKKTV